MTSFWNPASALLATVSSALTALDDCIEDLASADDIVIDYDCFTEPCLVALPATTAHQETPVCDSTTSHEPDNGTSATVDPFKFRATPAVSPPKSNAGSPAGSHSLKFLLRRAIVKPSNDPLHRFALSSFEVLLYHFFARFVRLRKPPDPDPIYPFSYVSLHRLAYMLLASQPGDNTFATQPFQHELKTQPFKLPLFPQDECESRPPSHSQAC